MTRRAPRSEKAIQNDTLIALSALPETMVWRNNTGLAWQGIEIKARVGSTIRVTEGMVILKDARPVKFGLLGSADILGVHRGVAVAVEVKTATGRQSEQQRHFERAWTAAGAAYVLARSPEEAVRAVRHSKMDLTEFE